MISISFQVQINDVIILIFQTKNTFAIGEVHHYLGDYFVEISNPEDSEIQAFDLKFGEKLRIKLFENRKLLEGLDL